MPDRSGTDPRGLEAVSARRVAVCGLGREGLGLLDLLHRRGVTPLLVDDDPGAGARARAVLPGAAVRAPSAVDWSGVDVVVRAPGVGRYRPELQAAASSGAAVTTLLALWLHDFADQPVLAVTGTKGKSTTAALAAAILRAQGRRVALVGNIGVPVTETYGVPRAEVYVVEVSSYQAVDVRTTPPVCVLTGLGPDHLDWHGGVEAYYRDKLHLLAAGPDGATGRLAVDACSHEAERRTSGHPDRILYGCAGRVTVGPDGVVTADGRALADTSGWAVAGHHNRVNLCGAVSGIALLDGALPAASDVATAVAGFAGLPSRCEVAGEHDGRTFVDDALASNPTATAASLEVFAGRPLALVAGGADRGVDMSGLAARLGRLEPPPALVAVGPGGRCLADAVGQLPGAGRITVTRTASLEEGVEAAVAATPAGGVVLFSPAQPTPAEEGDYRDRSRRFRAAAGLAVGPASGGEEQAVGGGPDRERTR
ncbi:MAG: UDP-N-acetylmuramoyl-L-alanine--D-glutamate ligase [Acidimicrobiales bacterium]|nr:UDP-N-acetylmuramoyl-L-alanine--D-glutamate ligase [Acidimicrobiales bacterium]